MATLEDFRAWYERDVAVYAPWDRCVQLVGTATKPSELEIRIFTDKNRYSISVREPAMRKYPVNEDAAKLAQFDPNERTVERMDNGYLGCISQSRKWRAGEDWHRGSDLPDGDLSEKTWYAILGRIVSYELVDIVRPPKHGYGVRDDGVGPS